MNISLILLICLCLLIKEICYEASVSYWKVQELGGITSTWKADSCCLGCLGNKVLTSFVYLLVLIYSYPTNGCTIEVVKVSTVRWPRLVNITIHVEAVNLVWSSIIILIKLISIGNELLTPTTYRLNPTTVNMFYCPEESRNRLSINWDPAEWRARNLLRNLREYVALRNFEIFLMCTVVM